MKNKRILITGGAGFIGSHLCRFFLKNNYYVRAVDNYSTGNKSNIIDLFGNNNFEFIEGDIRDLSLCKSICENIDFISHQAALGSVPRSIKDPITSNDVNVQGFLNVIFQAQKNKIKKFIYASSSSVYGDNEDLPKRELMVGKPMSPYALTKSINEDYAEIFSKIYGLKTIGLRYFNVFGPNQDPNGPYAAVIPKFINQFLKNKSPVINGDGEFSRDFTYIKNVQLINLLAVESNNTSLFEVFNVACGKRITINKVAYSIRELLSKHDKNILKIKILNGPNRVGDVPHSLASISKAKDILKYYPNYNFDDGLKETIDWYCKD